MSGKISASTQNVKPRLSITLVDAVVESDRVLAKADTSRIIPVVTRSYVDLTSVATYTIPATSIAYVNLFLDAALDNSGLFRYVPESVVLTDGKVFSLGKTVSDTYNVSDSAFRNLSIAKSDTASISDALEALIIFIRYFDDTSSLSDAISKTANLGKSDSVSTTDALTRTFSKYISDSFALNDLSDVNGTTVSFNDYTNNVVSASDARSLSNSKLVQDSLTPSDSGYLFSQGYCDLTYFAEDYVGYYRTF